MQGALPGPDIRLPPALIVQPRLDEGHPEGAVMMPQGVSQLFGIEVGEQEAEAPDFATTRRRQQRDPTHLRRHDHRIIGDFFIRCLGNAQLDGFAFLRDDAAVPSELPKALSISPAPRRAIRGGADGAMVCPCILQSEIGRVINVGEEAGLLGLPAEH